MESTLKPYGYELLVDLHGCNTRRFTRPEIEEFFDGLCARISMQKCDVHFWDDVGVAAEEQQTNPSTKGTSAVCFILTSTIVVHTLDLLSAAYVNIFSCKYFDPKIAESFVQEFFEAKNHAATFVERT